jgi:hypothetical protein
MSVLMGGGLECTLFTSSWSPSSRYRRNSFTVRRTGGVKWVRQPYAKVDFIYPQSWTMNLATGFLDISLCLLLPEELSLSGDEKSPMVLNFHLE